MPKKILFIMKSPPYGSLDVSEGFRMATAMIAMDVLPQMLFIDDGVYCLLKNQKPEAIGSELLSERLKTIADLIGLIAVSDSMQERRLESKDFDGNFSVKIISLYQAAELMLENDTVLTF